MAADARLCTSSPSHDEKEKGTMGTTHTLLAAEIDRLYLEYIRQYALGKFEPYLIAALTRDPDDRART
jgi:hypothetical protein